MTSKPASEKSTMPASVPPAITTSATPRRISANPSPMDAVPVAQARTGHRLGPRAPMLMATCPVAEFASMAGTANALMRR